MIKAPFNGTVAKTNIDNHQIVQANQPVLLLQKDRFIDVVIQVPESLASQVTRFNPNTPFLPSVVFSHSPEHSYPARLKEFATQVTPGSQSYEVVFTLPMPQDISVLPGMSAQLTIDLSHKDASSKAITLPASAIIKRDLDGETIVWTYNSDTGAVQAKIITLGKVTTDVIEVLEVIAVGDKVVVAGVQYLKADQQVKPLHWQRGV